MLLADAVLKSVIKLLTLVVGKPREITLPCGEHTAARCAAAGGRRAWEQRGPGVRPASCRAAAAPPCTAGCRGRARFGAFELEKHAIRSCLL